MKKVLLLSLGLVMGFSAFAQKAVVKGTLNKYAVEKVSFGTDVATTESTLLVPQTRQSVVDSRYESFDEWDIFYTTYDLQSNSFLANRMYQREDGAIGAVATLSMAEDAGASDRGTGYNFYDGSDWGEYPEERFENERTGWPSIAQYGAEGEIVVNHGAELNYYIREKAGEGEWVKGVIPAPTGLESVNGSPTDFEAMTWARVATSGENHDIIHVVAACQIQGTGTGIFYARSTDGENWNVNWAPTFEHGDCWNTYSADDYAIATNGDNVAILFCGYVGAHAVVYQSADNGETWERQMVWENPYYGLDFTTDPASLFESLLFPAHGTIAVDNEGVAHVAVSVGKYGHPELGDNFSIWSGIPIDGIAYWNSEMGQPFQPVYEDLENSTLMLWIPEEQEDGTTTYYMGADSTYFCGWFPPHPETWWQTADNDKVFWGNTKEGIAGDYMTYFGGCLSAYPSIAVDAEGNLAVAYSSPDQTRLYDEKYYFRSVYVSYLPKGETQWQIAADNVLVDFFHQYDEATGVSAVPNPVNPNEFVFSYLADAIPGFAFGTEPSQSTYEESTFYVFAITPSPVGVEEQVAKDVVYNVYPNPAKDYIVVSSKMDADATITFTNIAGQTVKVVNKCLTAGENSINISDLNGGVYFCTVSANGFSHTSKVVVK